MNYSDSIYKLCEKLHWLKIADDGVLEFYIDNHMLQTFRMCEAKFFEEFVEGYRPKGGRIWFLDFGSCVHECIETYYKTRNNTGFDWQQWAIENTKEVWQKYDMEYYSNPDNYWKGKSSNEFKTLGGYLGFSAMMLQYAGTFNLENDRFRVIGAELYFGKNKEVPLTAIAPDNRTFFNTYNQTPFRLYLAGKIDLLMDDGFNIGPMDHKTSKDFRGLNPAKNYEIQEGMTGYVFAAKKILETWKSSGMGSGTESFGRQCNKIWMNFLQVKPEPDISKRFKRIPLYKSDWELEEYRQRQISTVARLYQLLENYKEDCTGLRPYYNHMACTNYMHQTCPFQSAHHQKDKESQLLVLNADFVKDQSKIWDWSNPEE